MPNEERKSKRSQKREEAMRKRKQKNLPPDSWTVQELLVLASFVKKSGEKNLNWMSVSREMKSSPVGNLRPPEWWAPKNCATQYNVLMTKAGPQKRSRRENSETLCEVIINNLIAERTKEVRDNIVKGRETYLQYLKDIEDIENGVHDGNLSNFIDSDGDSTTSDSDLDNLESLGAAALPDSSQVSPQLTNLVQTAIAGATEDDKSRNMSPTTSGAPTLSKLLELPPIDRANQPLPELPTLMADITHVVEENISIERELISQKKAVDPIPLTSSITPEIDVSKIRVDPGTTLDTVRSDLPKIQETDDIPVRPGVLEKVDPISHYEPIEFDLSKVKIEKEDAPAIVRLSFAPQESMQKKERTGRRKTRNVPLVDKDEVTITPKETAESAEKAEAPVSPARVSRRQSNRTPTEINAPVTNLNLRSRRGLTPTPVASLTSENIIKEVFDQHKDDSLKEKVVREDDLEKSEPQPGPSRGLSPRTTKVLRSPEREIATQKDDKRPTRSRASNSTSSATRAVYAELLEAKGSNPCSPSSSATSCVEEDKEVKVFRKALTQVMNTVAGHKHASVFLKPITDDVAPGYSQRVSRPLDLSTLKRNMESGVLRSLDSFERDLFLIFLNSYMYNSYSHELFPMTHGMDLDCKSTIDQFKSTHIGKLKFDDSHYFERRHRRDSSARFQSSRMSESLSIPGPSGSDIQEQEEKKGGPPSSKSVRTRKQSTSQVLVEEKKDEETPAEETKRRTTRASTATVTLATANSATARQVKQVSPDRPSNRGD